ncbi:MAG TPA: phosphotransferase [Anaerolineae bacterium]|nr:phosphotransferase [Anaerolineae bacterium]
MLEPPGLLPETIAACLQRAYGVEPVEIAFLPLGADVQSAVFRVAAAGGLAYFLKVRWGTFDEMSVALPGYLASQGMRQIIPPLQTRRGMLWAKMGGGRAVLYRWVEGHDGFAAAFSPAQWAELGAALRKLHEISLPPAMAARVSRETYAPQRRNALRRSMSRLGEAVDDPAARRLATFLEARSDEVAFLVERAEALTRELLARPRPPVLCHSDVHAANILVGPDGSLHIVDWDEPVYAPKERDLMFPGGAQGFLGYGPEEEEALFFRGYGGVRVDAVALAYYRYERIVADLSLFCEQLLFSTEGGTDRAQALGWAIANFAPGGTLERARAADQGSALAWRKPGQA